MRVKSTAVLLMIVFAVLIWAQFHAMDMRHVTYVVHKAEIITQKVIKNKWKWGRVKMGTYSGDVNPYPINVVYTTSPFYGNFTVPIPPGSVVTSGTWTTNTPNQPYVSDLIYAPDATANPHTITGGANTFNMDASDITGINNGGVFQYFAFTSQPESYPAYVTVTLTGTFPQPPVPGSPVHVGTASPGIINLCLLNIRDARCMMGLQSIYVSNNVSNLPAPIGVQILRPENVSFLTITPGLINLNWASGNASCSMRVYKEIIGSHMQWISNAQHLTPPMHCQLAAMPVLIPWDGPENVFVEFEFLSSPLPASSSLEFSISPILMQGRSA